MDSETVWDLDLAGVGTVTTWDRDYAGAGTRTVWDRAGAIVGRGYRIMWSALRVITWRR